MCLAEMFSAFEPILVLYSVLVTAISGIMVWLLGPMIFFSVMCGFGLVLFGFTMIAYLSKRPIERKRGQEGHLIDLNRSVKGIVNESNNQLWLSDLKDESKEGKEKRDVFSPKMSTPSENARFKTEPVDDYIGFNCDTNVIDGEQNSGNNTSDRTETPSVESMFQDKESKTPDNDLSIKSILRKDNKVNDRSKFLKFNENV